MTKEIVLSVLEKMPDEFDLDELLERLILIEKAEEGRTISHEEVKKIIEGWRK
jgi:hypothetical protein